MNRKLKSVKNIIVAWAAALITYIVVANKGDFTQLAVILAAIPVAYIPSNVYQKKIESEREQ